MHLNIKKNFDYFMIHFGFFWRDMKIQSNQNQIVAKGYDDIAVRCSKWIGRRIIEWGILEDEYGLIGSDFDSEGPMKYLNIISIFC